MGKSRARFFVFGALSVLVLGFAIRYADGLSPSMASADTGSSRVGRYVATVNYSLGDEIKSLEDDFIYVTVVDSETGQVVRRERCTTSVYVLFNEYGNDDNTSLGEAVGSRTGRYVASVILPLERESYAVEERFIFVTVVDSETGFITRRTKYPLLAYTDIYE